VLVFARAPIPGEAKTRLIPALGPGGAALLQQRMTERALETACAAAVGPVSLWCSPSIEHPFFAACRGRFEVRLQAQCGATLGERLLHAHESTFGSHARLLVMGADCPILTRGDLCAAAAALGDHDAVVIPAEDGGYVALGLARPCPAAFESIDWGSARVLGQTLERLARAGLSYRLSDPLWDVDRPEDLVRLASRLPCMLERPDPAGLHRPRS
jgi:rSAM/selenodomain-associated transferase 1